MCVVSNIGDDWRNKFPDRWPNFPTNPIPQYPIPQISRYEFDELKREMEALKKLLQEAKKFDEATGQQDCEMESKVKFIKQIAEALGVDMTGVFKTEEQPR
jgi:hypothetical protein